MRGTVELTDYHNFRLGLFPPSRSPAFLYARWPISPRCLENSERLVSIAQGLLSSGPGVCDRGALFDRWYGRALSRTPPRLPEASLSGVIPCYRAPPEWLGARFLKCPVLLRFRRG
jgi:hypothetical protein